MKSGRIFERGSHFFLFFWPKSVSASFWTSPPILSYPPRSSFQSATHLQDISPQHYPHPPVTTLLFSSKWRRGCLLFQNCWIFHSLKLISLSFQTNQVIDLFQMRDKIGICAGPPFSPTFSSLRWPLLNLSLTFLPVTKELHVLPFTACAPRSDRPAHKFSRWYLLYSSGTCFFCFQDSKNSPANFISQKKQGRGGPGGVKGQLASKFWRWSSLGGRSGWKWRWWRILLISKISTNQKLDTVLLWATVLPPPSLHLLPDPLDPALSPLSF